MHTLTLKDLPHFELKQPSTPLVDMGAVASVILGGGAGNRLHPLTLTRCKPAIDFGGKYRLIDIPISNSIHANCCKIFVLTQFLSASLHKHIFQTYKFPGNIEVLAAEQKPSDHSWYKGTADAVRKNLQYLLETPADYFLILSGDQLYHIDFREMVRFAKNSQADVVVAALAVDAQDAMRMGVIKINSDYVITDFHEKPDNPRVLDKLVHTPHHSKDKHYLGSMGIYLFKRKALVDLLTKDQRDDFGKHLIPNAVASGKAAAYIFNGYWEDVGTIESFYQANLNLTSPQSPFNLYNEKWPIISCNGLFPPTQFSNTDLVKSLVCEGCIVGAKEISNSLLGPRTVVHQGTVIQDSYVMGNDYYASEVLDQSRHPPHPHIGENCVIKRCIIDKNVVIGRNVQLVNKKKLNHYDGGDVCIRDGVIVVQGGSTISDGFVL